MTQIYGTVADGFGAVADAFERNFAELGELGAAFSLSVDGEVRADLWAGVADKQTGRSWDENTCDERGVPYAVASLIAGVSGSRAMSEGCRMRSLRSSLTSRGVVRERDRRSGERRAQPLAWSQ